jgi:hypothetical protein
MFYLNHLLHFEMDNSVIGWALVPLDPDMPLEPAIAPTDVNTNE